MKKEQAYFVSFLFLLLITISLLDFSKPIASGKIQKMTISPNHITLTLEGEETKIYLQNTSKINLKTGQEIQVYGKEEKYLNSSMIFADKISCLDC